MHSKLTWWNWNSLTRLRIASKIVPVWLFLILIFFRNKHSLHRVLVKMKLISPRMLFNVRLPVICSKRAIKWARGSFLKSPHFSFPHPMSRSLCVPISPWYAMRAVHGRYVEQTWGIMMQTFDLSSSTNWGGTKPRTPKFYFYYHYFQIEKYLPNILIWAISSSVGIFSWYFLKRAWDAQLINESGWNFIFKDWQSEIMNSLY